MRLTYRGKVYRIGFQHGHETNEIPGHGPTVQDFTIATIRTGERTESETDNILATAKVHRFYRDQPSLEAARKAALKSALRATKTTQKFRAAVWETYHSRPGGIAYSGNGTQTPNPGLPATSASGSAA